MRGTPLYLHTVERRSSRCDRERSVKNRKEKTQYFCAYGGKSCSKYALCISAAICTAARTAADTRATFFVSTDPGGGGGRNVQGADSEKSNEKSEMAMNPRTSLILRVCFTFR